MLSRTELPALPPSPRNLPPCPQHHPPPHLPSCPRRKITLLPPGATTRLGSGSGPSHLLKDFSPPGALPPLRDQVPPLRGCLRVTKTFPDSVPPLAPAPSLSTSAGRPPGEAPVTTPPSLLPPTLVSTGSPRHRNPRARGHAERSRPSHDRTVTPSGTGLCLHTAYALLGSSPSPEVTSPPL